MEKLGLRRINVRPNARDGKYLFNARLSSLVCLVDGSAGRLGGNGVVVDGVCWVLDKSRETCEHAEDTYDGIQDDDVDSTGAVRVDSGMSPEPRESKRVMPCELGQTERANGRV